MEWDLGLWGLGVLLLMAGIFGLIVHFVAGRRSSRPLGLIAGGVYVVAGLFTSEVLFGWATEEELQPNIDGLSYDEVFLLATTLSVAVLLVARFISRRTGHRAHLGGGHPSPHAP